MTPALVGAIFDVMMAMSYVLVFAMGIVAGYWMGRNSAELPFRSMQNPKKTSQGSTAEPEHGDIFREAMQEDTDGERVPTIGLDKRL
jgi:hypothetical protein